MKRELLILRHGKSDWHLPVDDFNRPLKKRGRKNAQQMGGWLLRQELVPDYVISSPAYRALETARLACSVMQLSDKEIRQEPVVYGADVPELLQVLHAVSKDAKRVLMVGHNPGLEDLVLYLAAGKLAWPEDGKLMPTAALARFRIKGSWAEIGADSAGFVDIQYPRHLTPP